MFSVLFLGRLIRRRLLASRFLFRVKYYQCNINDFNLRILASFYGYSGFESLLGEE